MPGQVGGEAGRVRRSRCTVGTTCRSWASPGAARWSAPCRPRLPAPRLPTCRPADRPTVAHHDGVGGAHGVERSGRQSVRSSGSAPGAASARRGRWARGTASRGTIAPPARPAGHATRPRRRSVVEPPTVVTQGSAGPAYAAGRRCPRRRPRPRRPPLHPAGPAPRCRGAAGRATDRLSTSTPSSTARSTAVTRSAVAQPSSSGSGRSSRPCRQRAASGVRRPRTCRAPHRCRDRDLGVADGDRRDLAAVAVVVARGEQHRAADVAGAEAVDEPAGADDLPVAGRRRPVGAFLAAAAEAARRRAEAGDARTADSRATGRCRRRRPRLPRRRGSVRTTTRARAGRHRMRWRRGPGSRLAGGPRWARPERRPGRLPARRPGRR